MASLATTENCPYCLQNINQGQHPYGPICRNHHRAHLNCIMNQFESNRRFNIDTWTCPLCRASAYYSPDREEESLNQVLRRRFPRRIARLEAVPLVAPVDYLSEGESEEEPDDSQNEELTIEDRLIQQYPFLGAQYRENEGEYRELIMNGLTAQVRMRGVFHQTAEFVDTVDTAHMGAILLTQWYNMYNMARSYEGEGDMEEVHSSLSNQSPFFRALTMAILLGYASGFWDLNRDQVLLLTDMRRRAAQADGVLTGGKRKKKTRRKRGRGNGKGTKRKRDGPTTPRRPPRRRPYPAPEPVQNEEDDYDEYEELMNHIADNVDPDDPNFIQGGKRRKKKTRKIRGGRFVDVTPEYIRKNFDQLVGREVELSEEGVQKKIIIYKLRDETDDIVDYKDIIPIPTFFYYINVDDNQDIQTPRLIGVIDLTEYGPGSIKINVANIQDGSGKRRKKKGGVEEPSTPPRPPKDNDIDTNRYPPGFTLPPPQVPVRIAQPSQVRMRRRGSRERFRDILPGARAPTQRMINEHNERFRRDQNNRIRNVAGDVLEACTGSRCGLGGRRKKKRKKKTRKKKYKKRRTKKKSRRRRKRR